MDQNETKGKSLEFLNKHTVATLATVSDAHAPHASAMYFLVDKEFNFFFLTKSSTKRFLHIQNNDKVAIVVTKNDSPLSVQIEGAASLVVDPLQQREILHQIAEKSAQLGMKFWPPPVSQLQDGEIAIIKVTPIAGYYCDFANGEPGKTSITQIIP